MSANSHCFNVELATVLGGCESALVLQHFYTWHEANSDNEDMNKDGRVWFFLSRKSILSVFPYISEKRVRNIIDKFIAEGYVLKGNYSTNKMKRANWYSLTNKAVAIFAKKANALAETANDWSKRPLECNKENIEENPNSNPMINLTDQELSDARRDGAIIPSLTIVRKKTIDEREKDFATKVMSYDYPKEMLENFITYWTQKLSENGNKMLFESQKAFEIGKRLATWHRNDKARNRSYIQEYKEKNEKKKTPWENLGVTEEYYNKFIK